MYSNRSFTKHEILQQILQSIDLITSFIQFFMLFWMFIKIRFHWISVRLRIHRNCIFIWCLLSHKITTLNSTFVLSANPDAVRPISAPWFIMYFPVDFDLNLQPLIFVFDQTINVSQTPIDPLFAIRQGVPKRDVRIPTYFWLTSALKATSPFPSCIKSNFSHGPAVVLFATKSFFPSSSAQTYFPSKAIRLTLMDLSLPWKCLREAAVRTSAKMIKHVNNFIGYYKIPKYYH